MTELRSMLADTADKVLRADGLDWTRIAESGLCNVMVPEAAGGFGGGWEDALLVLRQLGATAAALPVAETIVGNRLLAASGLALDEAAVTFVTQADGDVHQERDFTGVLTDIPFDDVAARIAGRAQRSGRAFLLVFRTADAGERTARTNLAGEPRGALAFDKAPVEMAAWPESELHGFTQMGALARTCQIAGAMEHVLAMSVEHAKTRTQFGRAIGNFQAIQQQLAIFASETAAVGAAAAAACRAADRGDASFEIAAAKLRANRAVDVATNVAHQVHGAIGITREHALHRYTQRLWSWKSEFGNDRRWATELGASVTARGADTLWRDLTAPRVVSV
ncbi:MAG TPA: acyl-CoA dehydrogenase family protein [Rhizomicrobium sp.]|jgi:acyl-CoA dehydrogenase|nr:acyl-CoA dehydrogenase family protein [Rhizomicrobium sp.]